MNTSVQAPAPRAGVTRFVLALAAAAAISGAAAYLLTSSTFERIAKMKKEAAAMRVGIAQQRARAPAGGNGGQPPAPLAAAPGAVLPGAPAGTSAPGPGSAPADPLAARALRMEALVLQRDAKLGALAPAATDIAMPMNTALARMLGALQAYGAGPAGDRIVGTGLFHARRVAAAQGRLGTLEPKLAQQLHDLGAARASAPAVDQPPSPAPPEQAGERAARAAAACARARELLASEQAEEAVRVMEEAMQQLAAAHELRSSRTYVRSSAMLAAALIKANRAVDADRIRKELELTLDVERGTLLNLRGPQLGEALAQMGQIQHAESLNWTDLMTAWVQVDSEAAIAAVRAQVKLAESSPEAAELMRHELPAYRRWLKRMEARTQLRQ